VITRRSPGINPKTAPPKLLAQHHHPWRAAIVLTGGKGSADTPHDPIIRGRLTDRRTPPALGVTPAGEVSAVVAKAPGR